jgi:Zn finger protein HypA/HybF involved in hydrogenase expression
MPLVTCKDCGKPVSTSAVACPGCGAPVIRRKGNGALIIGVGVAAVVLFFVIAVLSNSAPPPLIQAKMGFSKSQVVVTNEENVRLDDCTLAIADLHKNTYRIEHVSIEVGESRGIDADTFTDAQSLHFSAQNMIAKELSISCKTAAGERAGSRDLFHGALDH